MKRRALDFLYFYLAASAVIGFIRMLSMDCETRYVDFVYPLSRLHCKVRQ